MAIDFEICMDINCLQDDHLYRDQELFAYTSVKDKGKTNKGQSHKHKDKDFEWQPGAPSRRPKASRIMMFGSHEDGVFGVCHKHVVVNVSRHTWQVGKVCPFKLVVHLHEKLHGQCVEKHV